MKTRLTSILTALFVIALGFHGAPATAGPSVSLTFNGFFGASPGGGLLFGETDLQLPDGVAEAMDDENLAGDGYGALLGLHYEITVDDPSPGTPREWLLAVDLALNGGLLLSDQSFLLFDETDLGFTGPLSGIPITDMTGPFSVNDLAMLGGIIFDNLLSPCAGPPAVAIPFGACLYLEGPGGPLSGDLFVGFTEEFTEMLLDELGMGLPDDVVILAAIFEGEVTLTTAAVSEPGTLAVLGLGLVGIGFARRRRFR